MISDVLLRFVICTLVGGSGGILLARWLSRREKRRMNKILKELGLPELP